MMKRFYGSLRFRKGREEVQEFFSKKFDSGIFTTWFTNGPLFNHIALGMGSRVGACGRVGSKVSSHNLPSFMDKMCPTCVQVYKQAFNEWLDDRTTTAEITGNDVMRVGVLRVRALMRESRSYAKDLMGADI